METALKGLRSAKEFMWDQYCDRAENKAIASLRGAHAAQGESNDDAGCLLCPKDSFLNQIDAEKVVASCCSARFDFSCLDGWMRSSNARRTGLENGDRLKPVKCPECRAPLDVFTVQSLATERAESTIWEIGDCLTKLFQMSFEYTRRASDQAQAAHATNEVDTGATKADTSSLGSACAPALEQIQEGVQRTGQTFSRKIMNTLPDHLSNITMSQPKHPKLQDARQTTLAVMMLQQMNQLARELMTEDGTIDATNLPVAMGFYGLLAAFMEKLHAGARQEAFNLPDTSAVSNPQNHAQLNLAAEYIDDAYRATAMIANQLVEEVKLHVEQAGRYETALQGARIGVEMPDDMSASERSAVAGQWIDFTQAASVQKVNAALKNNVEALITISQSVLKMEGLPAEVREKAQSDLTGHIQQLEGVLGKVDDFVQRVKRQEEGVLRHEDAVMTIATQLCADLRLVAESLARGMLSVVEGEGLTPASATAQTPGAETPNAASRTTKKSDDAQPPAEPTKRSDSFREQPPREIAANAADMSGRELTSNPMRKLNPQTAPELPPRGGDARRLAQGE